MKKSGLLHALLALLLPLGMLSSTTAPSIINGNAASPFQIPWQVVIVGPGGVECGGAIIGPNMILTAAHCNTNQAQVFAATQQASQFSNPRTIASRIEAANYGGTATYQNDLAVLILNQPIGAGQAIRYDGGRSVTNPGTLATVAGFGPYDNNSPDRSPNFLSATVPIVSTSSIPGGNLSGITITDDMIVAGAEGKGPCNYDSGGPLFVNNSGTSYLVGVVSFRGTNNTCAVNGVPDGYTRISSYCQWILQQTVNAASINGSRTPCNGQSVNYTVINAPVNG